MEERKNQSVCVNEWSEKRKKRMGVSEIEKERKRRGREV